MTKFAGDPRTRDFSTKAETADTASGRPSALSTNRSSRLLTLAFGALLLFSLTLWFGMRGPGAAGAAESFPGQGFLPDNRAWEMVTPPDKNGGGVMPYTATVNATSDCSTQCAVGSASVVAYGDSHGFTNSFTQYMSRRTSEPGTQGWTANGITPPQDTVYPLQFANERFGYIGDYSPDNSSGVFRAFSNVPTADDPHPNVEHSPNLYLRTDLTQPGAGTFNLLTDSTVSQPTGNKQDTPWIGATSPDLSVVTFESKRQFADSLDGSNWKLFARANGEVHLINQVPAASDTVCGGAGPACSSEASSAVSGVDTGAHNPNGISRDPRYIQQQRLVSDDGQRIFYRAPVSSSGGQIAASRLYMRNDQGTADQSDDAFTRIQQSEKTAPESPSSAEFWFATADGKEAFFTTSEGLVDGDNNGSVDLYRYTDSADPANDNNLTRISIDSNGPDNPDVTDVLGVSPDGSYVYFVAGGDLVAGQDPVTSGAGLYLWHDGEIRALGQFTNPGEVRGELVVNSVGRATTNFDANLASHVTPGGDLLFTATNSSGFEGVGGYQGYDHGSCDVIVGSSSCRELLVYKATAAELQCASCNPSGAPATRDAVTTAIVSPSAVVVGETHLPSAISSDGRFVFFSTADSLVPGDQNGPCQGVTSGSREVFPCTDAYEYDTETEQLHLLSSGSGDQASYFADASDNGSDVFIVTASRLSAWDTDNAYDLYDARIDGGFPEPLIEEPCTSADDCRGESSGTPADDNPGSVANESDGNAAGAPPPDCTKKQNKLDKAEKKLRKAKKKAKKAHGKKAKKRAKKAKKRAKNKVKKAERKLERCRGGNS